MAYYQFTDNNGKGYGSVEIFYMDTCAACDYAKIPLAAGDAPPNYRQGYYWQACFPGCLPDGEPMGPFQTEAEAIEDCGALCER
jgi:hypothetical protein